MEPVSERARVNPVFTGMRLSLGTAAADEHEAHNHEADNGDNLETRDVELYLAKYSDRQEVDDAGYDAEDGNRGADGYVVAPVSDDDVECCRLDDEDGYPGSPVLPTDGKANGLIGG